MGVKTKKGKGRQDKFYYLAKEQGYRSRAAFKLIQLNRKYNFLSNCRALLDLCAAPGGWLQVAAKNMPMASLILGVDLVPIKPIRGTKTIIGDITTQATRAALKKEAKGNMFDVVVHDGAPNVGGAWSNAAYTQAALVLDSLKLATEFLVPKGVFITKVFRSKDYNALLYAFNQLFDKVESTKPTASRNASAEIFVVCQGFKAPAKVDPRLLDPRHLFQEISEVSKVMGPDALMRQKIKQRRHREGYEEGLSTSHRTASALEFLVSSTPVELLGKVTQFALDGGNSWQPVAGLEEADLKELADKVRRSPATGPEIRALCGDLQVLGRTEFKALLRWRDQLRKELKADLGDAAGEDIGKGGKKKAPAAAAADPTKKAVEGGAPVDPESALLAEMEAMRDAADKRDRKEKKKQREAKKKSRIRSAQLGSQQVGGEDNGPDDMFTLSTVTGGSDALARVAEAQALGERDMEMVQAPDSSDDDYAGDAHPPGAPSDEDDEDAALRYEYELDQALEDSYKSYLERKGQRDDVQKEKRRRLGMDLEIDDDTQQQGSEGDDEDSEGDDSDGSEGGDLEGSDGEGEEEEQGRGRGKKAGRQPEVVVKKGDVKRGGGLLVELDERRAGVAVSGPAMAAQWFGQELFNDPNLMADDDEDDEEEEEEDEESDQGDMSDGYARASSHAAAGPRQPAAAAKPANGKPTGKQSAAATPTDGVDEVSKHGLRPGAKKGDPGFEVVPLKRGKAGGGSGGRGGGGEGVEGGISSGSGTDSEDEFDLLDDQGKAEVLALAKRMLRRKEKESIVDAAYNRYAFHDQGMPRWFVEDERRHMRPILPVTKEEVEAEKERLRAIDARPIKKIAEAKGRAKRRVQAKLSVAREKAEAVAAQDDVPMNSKIREIEKLYAKARAAGQRGKGKKGGKEGKRGKGRKGPPLDKRMLKDKRATKAIEKRGGGRKGGKAGGKGGKNSNRKNKS